MFGVGNIGKGRRMPDPAFERMLEYKELKGLLDAMWKCQGRGVGVEVKFDRPPLIEARRNVAHASKLAAGLNVEMNYAQSEDRGPFHIHLCMDLSKEADDVRHDLKRALQDLIDLDPIDFDHLKQVELWASAGYKPSWKFVRRGTRGALSRNERTFGPRGKSGIDHWAEVSSDEELFAAVRKFIEDRLPEDE